MEAGDFFVLQTHYHYDVEADADQSSFAVNFATGADVDPIDLVTYLAPAEIPCGEGEEAPLCDRDAARQKAIDAYGREGVLADLLIRGCGNPLDEPDGFVDGVAKSSCTWPVSNPGEIVSVFGPRTRTRCELQDDAQPGYARRASTARYPCVGLRLAADL
jgi:hypothetical protein